MLSSDWKDANSGATSPGPEPSPARPSVKAPPPAPAPPNAKPAVQPRTHALAPAVSRAPRSATAQLKAIPFAPELTMPTAGLARVGDSGRASAAEPPVERPQALNGRDPTREYSITRGPALRRPSSPKQRMAARAKAAGTPALAKPRSSVQRACNSCSAPGDKQSLGMPPTCASCEEEQRTGVAPPPLEHPNTPRQPKLAAPPRSSQFYGDPSQDPAERQADEIGARIGAELGSVGAINSGPLPDRASAIAEKHLGVDLRGTRIQADGAANARAASLDALAVTEGSTVSFAKGQLSTGSSAGRALLGHELTHVAQQRVHGTGAQRQEAPQKEKEIREGSRWTVQTPQGGNLLLRVRPSHETTLPEGGPNSVGNLPSGTPVIIKQPTSGPKPGPGWFAVRGEVLLDGGEREERTGFVHEKFLVPAIAGEVPDEAIELAPGLDEIFASMPSDREGLPGGFGQSAESEHAAREAERKSAERLALLGVTLLTSFEKSHHTLADHPKILRLADDYIAFTATRPELKDLHEQALRDRQVIGERLELDALRAQLDPDLAKPQA